MSAPAGARRARVVSWNMNQPGHVGTHHEAWAFLERLDPDIALLQESVVPAGVESRYHVKWTRAWDSRPWGSAILSRLGPLAPIWEERSRGAVAVASCSSPSLGAVTLASIHGRVLDGRVIPALRVTFEAVRARLGPRFIVGGDLNTSRAAAQAWPRNGHAEFWRDVEHWGLQDCHYVLNGVERQSYWREWLRNKPPTVGNSLQDDHVFVDAKTFRAVRRCVVWDTREVRGLSDHGPLVVDLLVADAAGDEGLIHGLEV